MSKIYKSIIHNKKKHFRPSMDFVDYPLNLDFGEQTLLMSVCEKIKWWIILGILIET